MHIIAILFRSPSRLEPVRRIAIIQYLGDQIRGIQKLIICQQDWGSFEELLIIRKFSK
jgi:hypothetical protein